MLKIAICDDEQFFLDKISDYIKKEIINLNVRYSIKTFISGENLLNYSNIHDFDVIFLDIALQSINGIDIAKELREMGYEKLIVFITSFADYSIVGYKVGAFRFILKDNLEDELSECISDVISKLGLKKAKLNDLLMDVKDIIYMESQKHQVIIHLNNAADCKIYATLDSIEKTLQSEHFLRVHKSYLVNILYVREIERYILSLSDKEHTEISIPKARYAEIKKKISIKKGLWR